MKIEFSNGNVRGVMSGTDLHLLDGHRHQSSDYQYSFSFDFQHSKDGDRVEYKYYNAYSEKSPEEFEHIVRAAKVLGAKRVIVTFNETDGLREYFNKLEGKTPTKNESFFKMVEDLEVVQVEKFLEENPMHSIYDDYTVHFGAL